jgi:hypothetical protein
VRQRVLVLIMLVSIFLTACGGGEPSVTSTPVPSETPVIPPTPTHPPVVPLAILILPSDLDPEASNLYQKTVYDLAQSAGYRFQVLNSLVPAELEPGLKIVIALPPDPGIAALAAAAPDVQFLAINIPGLMAGGNVSVLGGGAQGDVAAFLAGYTAAMLTDDYRIGMILPKDNPGTASLRLVPQRVDFLLWFVQAHLLPRVLPRGKPAKLLPAICRDPS